MLHSLKIIKDSTEKISNLMLHLLKSHLENIKHAVKSNKNILFRLLAQNIFCCTPRFSIVDIVSSFSKLRKSHTLWDSIVQLLSCNTSTQNGCQFIEWVDTTCSAVAFHLVAPLKLPWCEGKVQLIAAMPGHHTVLALSAVHSLTGVAVGAVEGLSCVFLSTGCGLSQTQREFMEDFCFRLWGLGVGHRRWITTHFWNKWKLICWILPIFPHPYPFLTICYFFPGKSVQKGHTEHTSFLIHRNWGTGNNAWLNTSSLKRLF